MPTHQEYLDHQAEWQAGEDRAMGIAEECYAEFKRDGRRHNLSQHHERRLERMLKLAQVELDEANDQMSSGPFFPITFAQREVRKSLGMNFDHAFHRVEDIKNEITRQFEVRFPPRKWNW